LAPQSSLTIYPPKIRMSGILDKIWIWNVRRSYPPVSLAFILMDESLGPELQWPL
jgi:hypothetical protein